jgi:hypothetical protein
MAGQYVYDRLTTKTVKLPEVRIDGIERSGELSGKFNRFTGKFYSDASLDMTLTGVDEKDLEKALWNLKDLAKDGEINNNYEFKDGVLKISNTDVSKEKINRINDKATYTESGAIKIILPEVMTAVTSPFLSETSFSSGVTEQEESQTKENVLGQGVDLAITNIGTTAFNLTYGNTGALINGTSLDIDTVNFSPLAKWSVNASWYDTLDKSLTKQTVIHRQGGIQISKQFSIGGQGRLTIRGDASDPLAFATADSLSNGLEALTNNNSLQTSLYEFNGKTINAVTDQRLYRMYVNNGKMDQLQTIKNANKILLTEPESWSENEIKILEEANFIQKSMQKEIVPEFPQDDLLTDQEKPEFSYYNPIFFAGSYLAKKVFEFNTANKSERNLNKMENWLQDIESHANYKESIKLYGRILDLSEDLVANISDVSENKEELISVLGETMGYHGCIHNYGDIDRAIHFINGVSEYIFKEGKSGEKESLINTLQYISTLPSKEISGAASDIIIANSQKIFNEGGTEEKQTLVNTLSRMACETRKAQGTKAYDILVDNSKTILNNGTSEEKEILRKAITDIAVKTGNIPDFFIKDSRKIISSGTSKEQVEVLSAFEKIIKNSPAAEAQKTEICRILLDNSGIIASNSNTSELMKSFDYIVRSKCTNKEQKTKVEDFLLANAQNIFNQGTPEEKASLISALRSVICSDLRVDPKTGYGTWEVKDKASKLLLDNAKTVLNASGSGEDRLVMIQSLNGEGGLKGELAWSNSEGANILLENAQTIFNSGSPQEIEALFSALERITKASWSTTSQTNNAEKLIQNNIKTISEKFPSAKNNLSSISMFSEAKRLNISNLGRFKDMETLNYIIQERQKGSDPEDNSPLAVFIFSEADNNGAFAKDGVTGEKIKFFKENGYRVMYYEVSDKNEVAECLKNACGEGDKQKKADLIMFGFHGLGGYAMELGREGQELTLKDYNLLQSQNVGNYLKTEGNIVLWSCSAGRGKQERDNMVNMMRKLFPQAKTQGIFGPVLDFSKIYFDIDNNKGRPVLKKVSFDVDSYISNITPSFKNNFINSGNKSSWTTTDNPLAAHEKIHTENYDNNSLAPSQNTIFTPGNVFLYI